MGDRGGEAGLHGGVPVVACACVVSVDLAARSTADKVGQSDGADGRQGGVCANESLRPCAWTLPHGNSGQGGAAGRHGGVCVAVPVVACACVVGRCACWLQVVSLPDAALQQSSHVCINAHLLSCRTCWLQVVSRVEELLARRLPDPQPQQAAATMN